MTMDIMLLHSQEMVHGWPLYDYVEFAKVRIDCVLVLCVHGARFKHLYSCAHSHSHSHSHACVRKQQYRFKSRGRRWKAHDRNIDQTLNPAMQTVDQLCFSSQFYFANCFHSLGAFALCVVLCGV